MALQFRILTAVSHEPARTIVHVEWFDDQGAVIREDDKATVVKDQVAISHPEDQPPGSEKLITIATRELTAKKPRLIRNLGCRNSPSDAETLRPRFPTALCTPHRAIA